MKLFPNFTSISFDLAINIVGDELLLQLWIFDMFILVLSHLSENSTLSIVLRAVNLA